MGQKFNPKSVSILLIAISLVSLGALVYPSTPVTLTYTDSLTYSESTVTQIQTRIQMVPQMGVDYSKCKVMLCMPQLYFITATFASTHTQVYPASTIVSLTSTRVNSPYAIVGEYGFAALSVGILVFFAGIILLVRTLRMKKN